MCILDILCKCSVTTSAWYLPPRLVKCQEHNSTVTVYHPDNLALLQQFFDDKTLTSISADSAFVSPLKVSLPHFRIYNHSFHNRLAVDQKLHMSLTKMATAAKNDEQVFKTLSEPILDGQIDINTTWPDLNAILIFCTFSLSVLAIIGFIFAMLKIRKLSTTLLILQQTMTIKSEELNDLVYKNPQTTQINTEPHTFIDHFEWDHGSVAIGILVLILTVITLCLIIQRRKRGTTILLELTTGKHCATVPLITLPLCPSFLKINPPQSISHITLNKRMSCKLITDWVGFSVVNRLNDTSIDLPNIISLSWINRYRIRKVMQHPYTAYILVQHDGMVMPLPDSDTQNNYGYFRKL